MTAASDGKTDESTFDPLVILKSLTDNQKKAAGASALMVAMIIALLAWGASSPDDPIASSQNDPMTAQMGRDCLHTGCGQYGVCNQGACVCALGYGGTTCEVAVACIGVSCGQHGNCKVLDGSSSCVCESDMFTGEHCEIECNGHGTARVYQHRDGRSYLDCACRSLGSPDWNHRYQNTKWTGPHCETRQTLTCCSHSGLGCVNDGGLQGLCGSVDEHTGRLIDQDYYCGGQNRYTRVTCTARDNEMMYRNPHTGRYDGEPCSDTARAAKEWCDENLPGWDDQFCDIDC